jgi:hypothetical protein
MRTLAIVFAACLLIVPTSVWGQPSSGLIANPNPLTINVPAGAGPSSQVVNITFNGSPATITGVSTSTATGQNWLQAFSPSTGVVTTTVNPAGLSGSFFGTVVVNTIAGSITFQVNLTVGIPPPVTPAPTSLILVLTGLAAVALYQMRRRRFSVAIR